MLALAQNVGFADSTVEAQKTVDKPVMTFLVKEYGRSQAEQQTTELESIQNIPSKSFEKKHCNCNLIILG